MNLKDIQTLADVRNKKKEVIIDLKRAINIRLPQVRKSYIYYFQVK